MPNPTIRQGATDQPAAGPAPNGLLAYVSGDLLGAAAATLPKAAEGEPERRQVDLDVPGRGRMRITYRLNTYRHGRSRRWHWVAERADLVE